MAYKHLMKKKNIKPVLPVLDPVNYIEEVEGDVIHLPKQQKAIDGTNLIYNPHFNKQNAFTQEERDRFNLNGLLPAGVEEDELQARRELENINRIEDTLDKYVYLQNLLDRNVTLFYKVVCDNIQQMMPLVYTPGVGAACINYSRIFTSPKGIYVTIKDKGHVYEILQNWPVDDVKAIVFTDGERILGLGDLGINGMGIPVGKLQLYSACAGIPHHQCLPVCIDVGTNNEALLKDEFYLGIREKRVRGEEYDELIVEFMHAAQIRFGRTVLLQFEDFGNTNAFRLLDTTRESFTTFNDDIQGTASVSVAGVLAALKVKDVPSKLANHRIVFLGAGEAGTGIANLLAYAKKQENPKISLEEARKDIWLTDSRGLVHAGRKNLAEHKEHFAHPFETSGTVSFEDAIKAIKPTLLIGVSGMPQTFTPNVLKMMADFNKKPLIFALSNPTSKCECTAIQAYEGTDYRCIFASGSPFDPVQNPKTKKMMYPGQGNNAYIFPGLALGVIASGACQIPDELMYISATSLADQVSKSDVNRGSLYPPLDNIREVSFKIAVDVAQKAYEMGIATNLPIPADLGKYVASKMVENSYKRYA